MANILIIDDDAVFAEMIEQRLIRAGHQASVHLGPFGGTIAARREGLDLIILDVFMPGLDGGSLLDLMRRDNAQMRPKVIFCSSMDAAPLRELSVRHHADGFIPKGAGRQQLVNYVDQILQRPNSAETRHRPKT
jgi:DNA-binding response OmpR family regulator